MSAGTESLVEYLQEGSVVTLRLNDPGRRNGLSPELVGALTDQLANLGKDLTVRCAILTGSGSVFSAGGDPRRMLTPGLYPDMTPAQLRDFYKQGIQRLPRAFQELEIPVIAAVNGPALGAGCDLACWCDLRIAAQSASFASSFVKLGLVPGDGGAWILPRLIGKAHAMEMLLTGATIDAHAAHRMGLVSAVVAGEELMSAAQERARIIASNPPHAVRLTKRLANECSALSLDGALELSAAMQAMCHKMDDHLEAVSAWIEKRVPEFKGR